MKLLEVLITQLKKEPNFVTDNGELKKWVVLNKAQNLDEELLELLLEAPDLREKFFLRIKDALVFNQTVFIQFLEHKNFLNDSYTKYDNKVGLTIDNKYLKQRNELVLVWPFKDCILEGGQTREETKRDEIFFNEILAQDEITQLLEPKVLTNGKKVSIDGETIIEQFNRDAETNKKRKIHSETITDNLIIRGNNLLALTSLAGGFSNRIKLIYIDPPYNTGSDSFNYNDSFSRSTWLTFMKNRIEIAKKLLTKSGIFMIQCSFHQYAYLKLLMNELFEKHLCDFHIQVRHPDRALTGDKEFNDIIEYILIYSDDASAKMPIIEEEKLIDPYNLYITINDVKPEIIQCGKKEVEVYLPGQYQVVSAPPSREGLKKVSVRGSIREKNNSGRFFVKYLEPLKQYPPETIFKVPEMGDDAQGFRYFYSAADGKKNGGYFQGMPESSSVTKKKYPNFLNFEKEYNNVSNEGGVSFRNGKKPEELIRFLIEIFTTKEDIILDYHLGSGTTAAVAQKMGRQYIGIEQLNSQIELIMERMTNVIHGDSSGISNEDTINWQGGGEFVYVELKRYNEIFIEKISDAQDPTTLLEIWEQMKKKSFLNYNVDIKKQDEQIESFKSFPLKEQKHRLIELLDKNQLYVNLSSLEDQEFACTEHEKKITRSFYLS